MQKVKSVRDADVKGKRVLVRLDLDVPMANGAVLDDKRLRFGLPTLELLHEQGATIIVIGHAGRPAGKVVENLRMVPIEKRLRELIDIPNLTVRENLRFDPREEANNAEFAQELAALGDIYVNGAFADSHRAHASIVGIPKFLPSYAGLRFVEEIKKLSTALTPPAGSVAIIGGAKPETKIPLIEKFAGLYAKVLVGGAIADEYMPTRTNIFLPTDGVPELKGMRDIGPQTAEAWAREIAGAPFVLWNGPMGMYEKEEYSRGTNVLAEALTKSSCGAVVGGGDTDAALAKFKFDPERIFISTGGGAMLQFLAEGTLPGIEALKASAV